VLVVGSCDEYGYVTPDENPVDERQELRPLTPYALSKVAQDLMGYQYYTSNGLDVVRVRPFVQVGPRRPDRFVAGSFGRQVAEIEAGTAAPVIEAGNIDLERDITDVRDMVEGYALLMEKGKGGEVYNLGTGTPTSLRALLLATMRAAGIEAEIRETPALQRTGEPPVLVSDSSKMKAATGWFPRISLDQSAADTLDYWRRRIGTRARSIR
jgi:GDP-4-dehydro-6-deoxy-D-mannose reductase